MTLARKLLLLCSAATASIAQAEEQQTSEVSFMLQPLAASNQLGLFVNTQEQLQSVNVLLTDNNNSPALITVSTSTNKQQL